jgi:hypothetical protein
MLEERDKWERELKEMNRGKEGHPYVHPNSLIILLLIMKNITLKGYRFLDGFSNLFCNQRVSYSAIQKRISKLNPKLINNLNRKTLKTLGNNGRRIEIIKDGTGIQINGTYVWREKRYKQKKERKWKTLHITIDRKTLAILSVRVLNKDKREGESKEFRESIEEVKNNLPSSTKITKLYGDGGYDSNANFECCEQEGIEPVIRIRKPTRDKVDRRIKIKNAMLLHKKYPPNRERLRDKYAEEQIDWKRFVRRKKYGKRSGIEGMIGSFKRFFNEFAYSKIDELISIEFLTKALVWNLMVLG